MARMTVNVHDIIKNARAAQWDAKRLQPVFPTMPLYLVQKLLDGSAIVVNAKDDGSFDIYEPSVERTPM